MLNSGDIPNLPNELRKKARLLYRSTNPHDAYDFIGQLPTLSGSEDTHARTINIIREILLGNKLDDYLSKK